MNPRYFFWNQIPRRRLRAIAAQFAIVDRFVEAMTPEIVSDDLFQIDSE
jgi:hypothetical protein